MLRCDIHYSSPHSCRVHFQEAGLGHVSIVIILIVPIHPIWGLIFSLKDPFSAESMTILSREDKNKEA